MASKTDICNRALAKLGAPRVANVETTNNTEARTLNEMYDSVRDALLQSYPWNFALRRTNLAKDPTAPDWGYDNRFEMPADSLALYEVKDNPEYTISEGFIETDASAPLYIRYIQKVEDEGEYTPLFNEALASKLAYEAAERLAQSDSKKAAALQDFQFTIGRAFAADAIETPPHQITEDAWIEARD